MDQNNRLSETKIRCFIAVSLPVQTKKWLSSCQRQLQETKMKASWPKPGTMHLTLKFLGPIPTDRIQEIESCMTRIASQTLPFFLYGSGLGVFPSVKRARTLWAGIRGQTDLLEKLVKDLDLGLYEAIGIKKKKKRFSPHLTLARVKNSLPPKKIISLMQAFDELRSDEFHVKKINLIKSTLTQHGAIHEILFSASFSDTQN